MFSHITVGSNNLERAETFYDAVLKPLGFERRVVTADGGPPALCWVVASLILPRFYVYQPFDGRKATTGNGCMVAFRAASTMVVDAVYEIAIACGSVDAGEPGPRSHYGDGYYGAYFFDLDGNKIHVVHRGDLE